jgi:hypothetical protein
MQRLFLAWRRPAAFIQHSCLLFSVHWTAPRANALCTTLPKQCSPAQYLCPKHDPSAGYHGLVCEQVIGLSVSERHQVSAASSLVLLGVRGGGTAALSALSSRQCWGYIIIIDSGVPRLFMLGSPAAIIDLHVARDQGVF